MAKLSTCCFVLMFSLQLSFFLPSALSSPPLLSFQLHLQSPLNLHNASTAQPLSPFLFSDQPLFHFDESSQVHINIGSACGLYLAHPAASMDLRYLFFTASLQNYQGGHIASKEGENDDGGSLVLMGSVSAGAISVVGGTRAFAFASGQANVSIAAAGSEQLIISFDVELQYGQQDSQYANL